jgi:hypothetical protein
MTASVDGQELRGIGFCEILEGNAHAVARCLNK